MAQPLRGVQRVTQPLVSRLEVMARSLPKEPKYGSTNWEFQQGLRDPAFSYSVSRDAGYANPDDRPPPYPLAGLDPNQPVGPLYHGSQRLSHAAIESGLPAGGATWYGVPFPEKGTELKGILDPDLGSMDGDLGPAAIYTSTNPERAVAFGPTYQADVSASPSEFVGFLRRKQSMSPNQPNADAANRLLAAYRAHVGGKGVDYPSVRGLATAFMADEASRAALSRGLPAELFSQQGDLGRSWLSELLLLDKPYLMGQRDRIVRGLAEAAGSGKGPQSVPQDAWEDLVGAVGGTGRGAFRRHVVASGAPGFMERYPDTPEGKPEYHFAIYDPETIRSLIKMSLLAPVPAAMSQEDR